MSLPHSLATASLLNTANICKGFWAAPEATVRHDEVDAVGGFPKSKFLHDAFPDFNCEHAQGGRWKLLRKELSLMINTRLEEESPEALLLWQTDLRMLEKAHGFSRWLLPALDQQWVVGHALEAVLLNTSLVLACPLGMAAVVTMYLVTVLAETHHILRNGSSRRALKGLGDRFTIAGKAVKGLVLHAFRPPRLMLPLLAATRWPVLDMLAAAERMLLSRIHRAVTRHFSGERVQEDCFASTAPVWKDLTKLAQDQAWSASFRGSRGEGGNNVIHPHSKSDDDSDTIAWLAMNVDSRVMMETQATIPDRCQPLVWLYFMVVALACVEQAFVDLRSSDPELCLRSQDDFIRNLVWDDLSQHLLFMDFAQFPLFGLWLRFRHLSTHRLDLPSSTDELAEALGLHPRRRKVHLPAPPAQSQVGKAFDALKLNWMNAPESQGATAERAAVLTMSWGQKHAQRLRLWLEVAAHAQMATRTIVMCFDDTALAACRAAHARPGLCADTRDWPAGAVSKLFGILMCLTRNIDVLWLDSDVIVLQDPMQYLQPLQSKDLQSVAARQAEMLFSVEADSWNCVNSGIFFLRGTYSAARYLAYWISLFLERPLGSDQTALYLLLGLMPSMNYASFAQREGLLDPHSPRVQALGKLRTPEWGALEPRRQFTTTFEATYGGIEEGFSFDEVAVFHMLESWPKDRVPNPIYGDIRRAGHDPVAKILEGLCAADTKPALALLRRSERGWLEPPGAVSGRRDCRTSYVHGR